MSEEQATTTPLLSKEEAEPEKVELQPLKVSSPPSPKAGSETVPITITTNTVTSSSAPAPQTAAAPASPAAAAAAAAATFSSEYRFVHHRIPPHEGKLARFLLPILLLAFQFIFVVLFAIFGSYSSSSDKTPNEYPMFEDLHAITLLGFGFLMTFLKRYGYGSVGFNLLLVAFVVQWALIVRGWTECSGNMTFSIGLGNLVLADFTAIAVLISFGALLGKTTLTQLVALAIVEVIVQAVNEYVNVKIVQAYDVGRSVYVHLFGALFGLAVSKMLHCKSIKSNGKQASVYHSDLFSLIGTLFLWVYYPSFNGLLAKTASDHGQMRAIINTYAAISASCVVTFGISSLVGKGKISAMHVQHATLAGGIAIGSVADLNVQIYIALIVGSVAGLLSTFGYQYFDPIITRILKLHDTCSVQSLHAIPGLIAALLGALFAACATFQEYKDSLYAYYPARAPHTNSTDTTKTVEGRSAIEQALYQLIALGITVLLAVLGGIVTGILLRTPLFAQLREEDEMFDDEAQWITPDDYALKLTFASQQPAADAAAAAPADAKKDDSKA